MLRYSQLVFADCCAGGTCAAKVLLAYVLLIKCCGYPLERRRWSKSGVNYSW